MVEEEPPNPKDGLAAGAVTAEVLPNNPPPVLVEAGAVELAPKEKALTGLLVAVEAVLLEPNEKAGAGTGAVPPAAVGGAGAPKEKAGLEPVEPLPNGDEVAWPKIESVIVRS